MLEFFFQICKWFLLTGIRTSTHLVCQNLQSSFGLWSKLHMLSPIMRWDIKVRKGKWFWLIEAARKATEDAEFSLSSFLMKNGNEK